MKAWTLIDKAFALKQTALFSELDLDLLLTIAEKMNVSRYKKQEVIFPIHQEAHRAYLLAEGNVLIQGASGSEIARLMPGEFFGDESLFNDQLRAYTAIAETETTLLTLGASHILSVISECPSVALGLIRAFSCGISFRHRPRP